MSKLIKIGVINISDRASAGIYEDIPGKAVVETLKDYLLSDFETVYRVIPDEQDLISECGYPNDIDVGFKALEYQINLRNTFQEFVAWYKSYYKI